MPRKDAGELDTLFKALGHITRRRILRLLARGPRYPYELSKLLDVNRRVVLKHLESLENAGLVEQQPGESDLGPDRIYYHLKMGFGLSTTVLPDSFLVELKRSSKEIYPLEEEPKRESKEADIEEIERLLSELGSIKQKLDDLEKRKMELVKERGKIVRKIDAIMEQCRLSREDCRHLRSLIDPVIAKEYGRARRAQSWSEVFEEAMKMFRSMFPDEQDAQ
ncbi:MAG: helix-turn-helix domain-containing protein [Candidatus Lokiarchaeota archaeon]|nr:helix-turn-helix domain-containing protein [Candidatus Lokiarchaeota archaeon]